MCVLQEFDSIKAGTKLSNSAVAGTIVKSMLCPTRSAVRMASSAGSGMHGCGFVETFVAPLAVNLASRSIRNRSWCSFCFCAVQATQRSRNFLGMRKPRPGRSSDSRTGHATASLEASAARATRAGHCTAQPSASRFAPARGRVRSQWPQVHG